jgi:hypothetical protein
MANERIDLPQGKTPIGPGLRFLSLDVTTRRLTAIIFVWEPPFIGLATRSKRWCT